MLRTAPWSPILAGGGGGSRAGGFGRFGELALVVVGTAGLGCGGAARVDIESRNLLTLSEPPTPLSAAQGLIVIWLLQNNPFVLYIGSKGRKNSIGEENTSSWSLKYAYQFSRTV